MLTTFLFSVIKSIQQSRARLPSLINHLFVRALLFSQCSPLTKQTSGKKKKKSAHQREAMLSYVISNLTYTVYLQN